MKRGDFIKMLALTPVAAAAMKIKEFESVTSRFISTPKMPVLFIGHGHPMNALFDNDFTRTLGRIGKDIHRPNAIMVVSAHWETNGTYVSVNPRPKTIYDFGGFDDALFRVKYEPQGHPQLAREVLNYLPFANEDHKMGLDHGTWTVLKFIYPKADIPVFQLSIDHTLSPQKHFEIAQALKKMREKGVLIIGSGNIVHNLGKLDWHNINGKTPDWALEFDDTVRNRINKNDFSSLVNYRSLGQTAMMSVPTEDHYIPLLYTLGLASDGEPVKYLYEGFQYGSISMRCIRIG
jgi:4,5-DOPA dioxygenase extradiol